MKAKKVIVAIAIVLLAAWTIYSLSVPSQLPKPRPASTTQQTEGPLQISDFTFNVSNGCVYKDSNGDTELWITWLLQNRLNYSVHFGPSTMSYDIATFANGTIDTPNRIFQNHAHYGPDLLYNETFPIKGEKYGNVWFVQFTIRVPIEELGETFTKVVKIPIQSTYPNCSTNHPSEWTQLQDFRTPMQFRPETAGRWQILNSKKYSI
ncbi:MAG: hypothetical protein ABSD41_10690 [Candidatus Bathyarchaeia archaeon]